MSVARTIGGSFAAPAIAAALATDKPPCVLLCLGAGDSAADIAALVAEMAPAALILVLLAPELSALSRAMAIAAIDPLALELAPATRIGVLDLQPGADPADIAAAASFLAGAAATSAQRLTIAPR